MISNILRCIEDWLSARVVLKTYTVLVQLLLSKANDLNIRELLNVFQKCSIREVWSIGEIHTLLTQELFY